MNTYSALLTFQTPIISIFLCIEIKNLKIKDYCNRSNMIVYKMDGEFTIDTEILHEGKDFFRKMTVKSESIDGRGEIVASVELVKETPVNIIP